MGIHVADLRGDPTMSEAFLTDVLRSLVRAKSVNPGIYEEAMAQTVVHWLKDLPMEIAIVEFAPGRPSVGALAKGSGDGPRLVLNGHMDTVAIDDESQWSTDPFGGEVKDGFLYGRGACDMKAGLAVQIAVAHFLAKHVERLKGSLVLHFAAGEELGEPGTLSLLESGLTGEYGITTEPTGLKVATATRGVAHMRIRVKGRSIHASRAHMGLNPIWALRLVLEVLEGYEHDISQRPHPLLPGGTCTPTVLTAGVAVNAVPDLCELTLDRRLLPGEVAAAELEDLRARLAEIKRARPDFDFEISYIKQPCDAAEIDAGSGFARQILGTVEEITGSPTVIYGSPFGSDVRNLVNDAGIEAVMFGPGNIAECHCSDERVSLGQVRNAALVIAKVAADLLF